MVFLALRRWEPDTRWGLLALAVLGSALGDTLWTYLVANDSYHSGSAADLPYVLGAASVALAAWTPRTTDCRPDGEDRLTLLLPAVAAMCALGLLLYGALTGDLIAVALALAVAAVMAGVVRWLIAVRREAQAAVLRDVADELARKAEQQATVADLGRQAVANGDEQGLMELAAKVRGGQPERRPRGRARARRPAAATFSCGPSPAAGPRSWSLAALGIDALGAGRPTVLSRHGHLRPDRAQGRLLGRHGRGRTRRATDMSHTDVSFIQAVANVLGAVVARAREEQLEAQLQQSRRLESVGKLAGGVAHDFNNLLAVILNYADFALEAATDDGQRRDLEELSKAATRGAELVRQLLAFSRRRPVDAVALDLAEVVRDMEPMLRRTIGEHIDLRCWAGERAASHGDRPEPGHAAPHEPDRERARRDAGRRPPDDPGHRVRERRPADRRGHRRRDERGHGGQGIRPLLHDEAARQRHGPRARDRVRDRLAGGRHGVARLGARPWHARDDRPAGAGAALRRPRCRGAQQPVG